MKKYVAVEEDHLSDRDGFGEDAGVGRVRVKAVPAAFLIDREGRIVAQWTGLPANRKEVETKVEDLLKAD